MQNREFSRKMREDMTFEMNFEGYIIFRADDQRIDISGKEQKQRKRD